MLGVNLLLYAETRYAIFGSKSLSTLFGVAMYRGLAFQAIMGSVITDAMVVIAGEENRRQSLHGRDGRGCRSLRFQKQALYQAWAMV